LEYKSTGRRILETFEKQAKLFKALMHPVRLAILEILRQGEECVCHMKSVLGYRQAYISQQLSVLREAGLVQDRRDGWNIFYAVTRPEVYQVIEAAYALSGEGSPKNPIENREEGQQASCPCPKCTSLDSALLQPQMPVESEDRAGQSAG
jgi:DNA-binding transcriptional ArsR family regulator